jgi:hypothetical protein
MNLPLILIMRKVICYAGKTHSRPFRGFFNSSKTILESKVEAPSKTSEILLLMCFASIQKNIPIYKNQRRIVSFMYLCDHMP